MKIVSKDHWFWRGMGRVLMNPRFCTHMATTIGPVVAVPDAWIGRLFVDHRIMLKHEAVHIEQYRRLGLGNEWLGILPMMVVYLLSPLPVGFSWGRWLLEREAYVVTLQELKKTHGPIALAHRRWMIVNSLTSGAYGWTLPPWKWVRRYMEGWFANECK